jgi:hypothetical protein
MERILSGEASMTGRSARVLKKLNMGFSVYIWQLGFRGSSDSGCHHMKGEIQPAKSRIWVNSDSIMGKP